MAKDEKCGISDSFCSVLSRHCFAAAARFGISANVLTSTTYKAGAPGQQVGAHLVANKNSYPAQKWVLFRPNA